MRTWENLLLSTFLTGALFCIGSAAHSQSTRVSVITLNEVIVPFAQVMGNFTR
jgi:hypothetical protein